MIASYADYLVQVMRLIDGDDVSVSEIATATMGQIIGLACARVYRHTRSRYNEKAFSGVLTSSNEAPLPADFEAISVVHFGRKALRPASEEWLLDYLDCNPTGDAEFFCSAGTALKFGPAVADATAVQGRYFYRAPELTPANFSANTLIAREPDLFIYAALVEAIPFFEKANDQGQMFLAKFTQIVDAVNLETSRTATNAGRLTRTNSTRLVA